MAATRRATTRTISPEGKQFGEAVSDALRMRGRRQADLAKWLGKRGQSSASAWVTGRSRPPMDVVFDIEEYFEMAPGQLSIIFGYLPPSARSTQGVEEAIATSKDLDQLSKQMLVRLYKTLKEKDKTHLSPVNGTPKSARPVDTPKTTAPKPRSIKKAAAKRPAPPAPAARKVAAVAR